MKVTCPSPPPRGADAPRKSVLSPLDPSITFIHLEGAHLHTLRNRGANDRFNLPRVGGSFLALGNRFDLAKPGILVSVRTGRPAEKAFPNHSYYGRSSSRNAGWDGSRNSE